MSIARVRMPQVRLRKPDVAVSSTSTTYSVGHERGAHHKALLARFPLSFSKVAGLIESIPTLTTSFSIVHVVQPPHIFLHPEAKPTTMAAGHGSDMRPCADCGFPASVRRLPWVSELHPDAVGKPSSVVLSQRLCCFRVF